MGKYYLSGFKLQSLAMETKEKNIVWFKNIINDYWPSLDLESRDLERDLLLCEDFERDFLDFEPGLDALVFREEYIK